MSQKPNNGRTVVKDGKEYTFRDMPGRDGIEQRMNLVLFAKGEDVFAKAKSWRNSRRRKN